jgi:adenosylmethionine-8-amino-7-oxononanoate aminotransferase
MNLEELGVQELSKNLASLEIERSHVITSGSQYHGETVTAGAAIGLEESALAGNGNVPTEPFSADWRKC